MSDSTIVEREGNEEENSLIHETRTDIKGDMDDLSNKAEGLKIKDEPASTPTDKNKDNAFENNKERLQGADDTLKSDDVQDNKTEDIDNNKQIEDPAASNDDQNENNNSSADKEAVSSDDEESTSSGSYSTAESTSGSDYESESEEESGEHDGDEPEKQEKKKVEGDFHVNEYDDDENVAPDDEDDAWNEEEAIEEEKTQEKAKPDPSFVPRGGAFWTHDDRWDDTPEEDRRPQSNRKLWDKSGGEKWSHDLYVEEEQCPKTKEELLESERNIRRRAGQSRGNRRYDIQEFITNNRSRRRGPRNDQNFNQRYQDNDRNDSRGNSDQFEDRQNRRYQRRNMQNLDDENEEYPELRRKNNTERNDRNVRRNQQKNDDDQDRRQDRRRQSGRRQTEENDTPREAEQDWGDEDALKEERPRGRNFDREDRRRDKRKEDDFQRTEKRERNRRWEQRQNEKESEGDQVQSTSFNKRDVKNRNEKNQDSNSNAAKQPRGRGRGVAKNLKVSRKNAADFAREKANARKKKEEQKAKEEEENYENADEVVQEENSPNVAEYEEERQSSEEPLQVEEEFDESPLEQPKQPPEAQPQQAASKPKRYSSQRQRATLPTAAPMADSIQEQVTAVGPDGNYYEHLRYQEMYAAAGTPPVQGLMQHGEEREVPQEMNLPHGQPLSAMQHEGMIHQRLASMQQAGMASQEGTMPNRMMAPMTGMMAPHQMSPQQGLPTSIMPPMTQNNMPNMNTQMNMHPSYSSSQVYPGLSMMYQNSQYPMMGINPFIAQQMYGMVQGGGYYPQAMFQPQVSEQAAPQRRRPNTAIPIKAPTEG